MILEQNVPPAVRTWAKCQVKVHACEKLTRFLSSGQYFSMGTRGIYTGFVKQYGSSAGKKKFLEEYCQPEVRRLQRCCARYRALAERIRRKTETVPEAWLLSKEEALSLIGTTLRYQTHGKAHYITLNGSSDDGERIFCTNSLWPEGLDSLTLLSLGFGKDLK